MSFEESQPGSISADAKSDASTRASIFLIDDSRVVRAGLRWLLPRAGPYSVVGVDSDFVRALPRLSSLRPTRVLLDPYAGGLAPREALRQLRAQMQGSDGRIVIVTFEEQRAADELACDEVLRAMVSKESEPDEIVRALRALDAGDTYLCPRIVKRRRVASASRRAR